MVKKLKLSGLIERIIFRNDINEYSVIKLTSGEVACGQIPSLIAGDRFEAEGKWAVHPKYGRQFQVSSVAPSVNANRGEVIQYLGSGIIKGIREETAEMIVKNFGGSLPDVFNNSPEKLLSIKGIGRKRLENIKAAWKDISKEFEPVLFLISLGLSVPLARKVYKIYGAETQTAVSDNPYRLIQDIHGIGFERADKIAAKLGISADHKQRAKAWIVYFLNNYAQKGNTFIHFGALFQHTANRLGYQLSDDDAVLYELEGDGEVIRREDRIYPSSLYYAEREVEHKIIELTRHKNVLEPSMLSDSEELSDEQIEAVSAAFENGVTIITGGPGTGKTTSIKSIFETCRKLNLKCMLAAPTGRAAKRISQVIDAEAKTIHRLLEYNPFENYFNYNEDNQLETDVLIVDEISMVDIILFYRLLSAVPPETKLVLLGDSDQLPAIGPGNVMRDLINSGEIPVFELEKIFRQEEGSGIIELASVIRENGEINFSDSFIDVEFIEAASGNEIKNEILKRFEQLTREDEFDPIFETQVISPVYKGESGVNKLNEELQNMLNGGGERIARAYQHLRINDKVMQLRNNYSKNVFNGDIGIIQHFDSGEGKLFVLFENKMVEYNAEEFDEIKLAYAATVHKSQGSDYDCVFLSVDAANKFMLTKNLLYTAVTRAKKRLVIVGSEEALKNGVQNVREEKRYTSLFHSAD